MLGEIYGKYWQTVIDTMMEGLMGVSRVTLWKRIKKFGIQVDKQVRE